jgi:hypothetical protein
MVTLCHVCDVFPGDHRFGACSPECLEVFALIGGRYREYVAAMYRMAPEDYLRLLREQMFCCAICRRHVLEEGQALAVDHDHACCPGERTCGTCTRGLLCKRCNMRLGSVEAGRYRLTSWPAGLAYLTAS